MKKIYKLFIATLAFGVLAGFTSCSDDDYDFDGPGTVLPAPAQSSVISEIDIVEASFSWDAVADAVQYGVVLKDHEGSAIEAVVCKAPTVTFENLTPSTEYSVDICAYHAYDGVIDAPVTTINFQTLDPIVLDAPVIKSHKKQASYYRVVIDTVENAESYEYECTNLETGEVIKGTSVTYTILVKGLTSGNYEFRIKAISSDPRYADSGWSETIQFTF